MNNGTQNRTGSSFTITYPDFSDFKSPARFFTLHQDMGKQDVIDIHYKYLNTVHLKGLKTGVPVQISWKNDKAVGKFFGYVASVTPTTNQTLKRTVVVRCVGAAFGLKEGGNKIWTNKSASDIATEIAQKFKLKPVVTKSPIIFSQQSLIGHTYWEKIQELAKRIGYVAQVFGTELHFHPIDTMIDRTMSVIPVFAFIEPFANRYNTIASQTLDSFKPKVGDFFDGESYDRKEKTVFGIDPLTSKSYSSSASPNKVGNNLRSTSKDPLFKETLPGVITNNEAMAKVVADANAQLSRFSMTAEANGQGDPRVTPFATVEVRGTGNTTDGFWIVKKASHHIYFDGRYELEFTCITDGTGANVPSASRPSTAGTTPTRDLTSTTTTKKPTSTKLTGAVALIKRTELGFKVTPRRWEGQ